MQIIYNAKEELATAKANARLDDPASMKDLFNAVATDYYLAHTKKTFEDLEREGWYANSCWSDWAANCAGTEWESKEDCIDCALEAATQVLEEEEGEA